MTPESPAARLEPVAAFAINYDGATGEFVGYGSLVSGEALGGPLVLMHPRASRLLTSADERRQTKLRLKFPGDERGNGVIDGTLLIGAGADAAFASILPDRSPKAAPYNLRLTNRPHEHVSQILAEFLAEQERQDPSGPPTTTPEQPIFGEPGLHAPWCVVFPHCPGC
jgi:hypothetical protein